ncbi:hypothetical protein HW115_05070 [Verrucomicrobiaceae bacterium N1E253]|uniref:Uncharacterized protein n=1 Tax=Oceaniferula marina TaxID=2748318 RepID=A0A851GCR1_9BACT|nr:hypothetical protein [Oceaniferula marina]NWK54969.1 hypothetical protein [Oceaniferula marina]
MDTYLKYEAFTDSATPAEETNVHTVFVPCMKFKIGYSIRKQTDFPVVQEMVLRFIKTMGGEVREGSVCGFLNFSDQELRIVLAPLLGQELLMRENGNLRLTNAGLQLFVSNDESIPSISQAEAKSGFFCVENHCCLPLSRDDRSRMEFGSKYARLIPDCVPGHEQKRPDYQQQVAEQFSRHFPSFIQTTGDLEDYRSDKLSLHKVDYCRIQEDLVLAADVIMKVKQSGVAEVSVLPFDHLDPKTEERAMLRKQLIGLVEINPPSDHDLSDDVTLLRHLFGDDFLADSLHSGMLNWPCLMKHFIEGVAPKLQSGASVIFGSGELSRNRELISRLIYRGIGAGEYTKDTPLQVTWIRPQTPSWGRSKSLFMAIADLRKGVEEIAGSERVISLCLAENRYSEDQRVKLPDLKLYQSRKNYEAFDAVKYFRSVGLPPNVEIILVGEVGGLVLSHSFGSVNCPLPIPVGVYFEDMKSVMDYFSSYALNHMRSFPSKPHKKLRK